MHYRLKLTYLSWIEVYKLPWNVFSQRKAVEAFGNCCLDDLLQTVLSMATELPRMTMM